MILFKVFSKIMWFFQTVMPIEQKDFIFSAVMIALSLGLIKFSSDPVISVYI